MKERNLSVVIVPVAALFAAASAAAQTYTFDAPGSAAIFASSINERGAITGYYLDTSYISHGFVRDPGGNITCFDPPGSTVIFPYVINGSGAITGYYYDGGSVIHGFVRDPSGHITAFDPPGSTYTAALSINGAGAVAGYYKDTIR